MPKTISVVTGLLFASALAYQFRYDIEANTDKLRLKLHSVRTNLEGVVPENAVAKSITSASKQAAAASQPSAPSSFTSSFPLVTDTQAYVTKRLVPSVKHTWNDHVAGLAGQVSSVDVPEEVHRLFVTHILGDEPKKKQQ
ncbi:hypothetical protein BC937DRAFT_94113 [Endogone sp. FLAS-F59071]|nr:hypothetical protein BC937DRAFT_94113 [Endogone sp. FLAS-F59071]|eukprot:RUS22993.1 hypothetical protein BC937DRAFT_94113 [Endogone sp. FLAS-F59071]